MHLSQSEVQLVQVLAYQRAQHGVEASGLERQRSLEISEHQRHSRVVAPRDAQHTTREIDTDGVAPCADHRPEVSSGTAAGVEYCSPGLGASTSSVYRASIATTGLGVSS